MRKSKEDAAETRRRIVTAAAGEFREHGIVTTGLADLMKAAGLTHGGFYKHFESKDQVVAEACVEAMRALLEKLDAAPSMGSVLGSYLSPRHRDDPASGCPLSALGSELARSDEKTREEATRGFSSSRTTSTQGARSEDERSRRTMPCQLGEDQPKGPGNGPTKQISKNSAGIAPRVKKPVAVFFLRWSRQATGAVTKTLPQSSAAQECGAEYPWPDLPASEP
jgi:TetR/AcrR family transcriptional regulator, transcriptional repressor for nem operon